jgi:hypothetical protein
MTGGKSFNEAVGLRTDVAVDGGVDVGAWAAAKPGLSLICDARAMPAAATHARVRE